MGTPINRAPYNALVDDNGTGLTGTVWNKAAIQSVLLDPIDTAAANAGAFPYSIGAGLYVPLSSAVFNDLQPGGATCWNLEPTLNLTITGFAAEPDGRQHLILNSSGFTMTLPTQDTRSQVANRLIAPGFGTFVLGVWRGVWIMYAARYTAWIVLGP
ncbi:MAG TPA: hypothetical protein VN903_29915 [Polyangia bacterium]|nr:hypothetical protein [Polyangia bacterium]